MCIFLRGHSSDKIQVLQVTAGKCFGSTATPKTVTEYLIAADCSIEMVKALDIKETVKALAADVQLVQTHNRSMEAAIGSNKVQRRGLGMGGYVGSR